MTQLYRFWHLVTRFFGVLGSRRLSPEEQGKVNSVLAPPEARLFWDQQPIDQRHAYEVAERARMMLGDDVAAIRAALLHDVGKRHSRLGPVSRSLATVFGGLRLPMPDTWRRYREHGPLGAADLRAIGAERLSVAFAEGVSAGDPVVWQALVTADDGKVKALETGSSGNSMPPEVSA